MRIAIDANAIGISGLAFLPHLPQPTRLAACTKFREPIGATPEHHWR
jgi:hypothetical protein